MRIVVGLGVLMAFGCSSMHMPRNNDTHFAYRQLKKQKKLAEEERTHRREARRRHIVATRLSYSLKARRKRINRAVAREVRAELEARTALAPQTVVALFPVEASSPLDVELTDTLDALLYLELTAAERFRFMARGDVEAAAREMKRDAACDDERCAMEIGHALAAQRVLVPTVFVADGRCRLSLALYDLRTETGEWAATASSACTAAGLRDAATTVAKRLGRPITTPKRAAKPTVAKSTRSKRPMRTPFSVP